MSNKAVLLFAFIVAFLIVTAITVAAVTPPAPLTAEQKARVERYVCDQLRDKRIADMSARDLDKMQVCSAEGLY
jgi:hypothetical protein